MGIRLWKSRNQLQDGGLHQPIEERLYQNGAQEFLPLNTPSHVFILRLFATMQNDLGGCRRVFQLGDRYKFRPPIE
jgi:hypothetical protein